MLETAYAHALTTAGGGADAVRELCLRAAAEGTLVGQAGEALNEVRAKAEAVIRVEFDVPSDCRFRIEAWTAVDL